MPKTISIIFWVFYTYLGQITDFNLYGVSYKIVILSVCKKNVPSIRRNIGHKIMFEPQVTT